MWFRTALFLVLFLLVSRFLRDLLARINAGSDAGRVAPETRRPTGPSGGDGRAPEKAGATWPPGEITDVSYRESSPDEGSPP